MCSTVWAPLIPRLACGTVAILWLGMLVLLTSSTLIGASTTHLPVKTILMSFLDWKGFGCWDLAGNRNFPGIGAPPLTHSSGTTVDHICLQSSMEFLKLDGSSCVRLGLLHALL